MGQAKRRKMAGTYPEQTPKPTPKTRIKRYVSDEIAAFPMMMAMMSGMLHRRSGVSAELRQIIQKEMDSNG